MDQGVKNVGESWRLEGSPHSDSRGLLDLQLSQINPARNARLQFSRLFVATQDRVIPYYAPNSSIKHSKSDSKDCSQEIL
jgi:hypothetical protein